MNKKTCFRLTISFVSLALFILFIVGFFFIDKTTPYFYFLFLPNLINYLITFTVALSLINSKNKSSLLVNFYLFIFLTFPYIGIFLYFLFVTRKEDRVVVSNYKDQINKYREYENYWETSQLLKTSKQTSIIDQVFIYNYIKHKQPVYKNNHAQLLKSPYEHIKELVNLITKAEKFIHLEYYIVCDGHVLNYLLILLEEKIKNGVEVKMIIDDWGSYWKLKKKTRKKIKAIGIQIRFFNPIFLKGNLWWQFRNHNKIVVVDNKYALYGSCNISDEYYNITNYYFQTTELSVLLEGDIVNSLNVLFFAHWNMQNYSKKNDEISLENTDYLKQHSYENGNLIMQLVNSSPLMEDQIIKNNLTQMIYGAKKSIIISTPYFYPPKDIIESLKLASVLGVSIKILVPRQADFANFYRTIHRQLFLELVDTNIEIFEYHGFNHEKITIIDDEIVYIGSYNWDYRALYLNFESSLLIGSKSFTNSLKEVIQQQLNHSYQITKTDLLASEKILSNILINSTIRLFKPFL